MTQPVKPSLKDTIERTVMRTFGTPPLFHKIDACHTSGHCWRVNIWTKHLLPSGNLDNGIPYSFFMIVVDDGTITLSDPPLVNRFPVTPTPPSKPRGPKESCEPAAVAS